MPTVPDFVRNVMGSSAGAGSGEFHVYRHLRRKEYARQKYLKESAEKVCLPEKNLFYGYIVFVLALGTFANGVSAKTGG